MTETVVLYEPEHTRLKDVNSVHRTFDADALIETLNEYPETVGDPEEARGWLEDEGNVCLRRGKDFSLFSLTYPGVYTAHYFFSSETRGRKAIELAKTMLAEAYVNHGARSIRGLTPIDNRKAIWMSRHLGFTSYGQVVESETECELFIQTIDEFFGKWNS